MDPASKQKPNVDYYNWYNSSDKLRMLYPSDIVIGFIKNNLKEGSVVLDMGTGSGRHVILAAELGHEAHGLDLSDNGFSECKKMAEQRNLTVHLKKGFMDASSYADNRFDAVICLSSIGGNLLHQQQKIVNETYRILKPKGLYLVNFYGLKDGLYEEFKRSGTEVEDRTLVIPGNVFHPFAKEKLPPYTRHFSNVDEIQELFKSYSEFKQFEIYLPYGNANFNNDARPTHHLYVMAQK